MALTKEQETYLAALADRGIAELADIDARNAAIELETEQNAARDAKRAELEAAAQKLVDDGMAEFEATVIPTIGTADIVK